MGYFDALTSNSFETREDGRRLFFPWGILGHGYAIPSEAEYERLRRGVKAYQVVSLPLVIVAMIWKGIPAAAAVVAALIVWYAFWARAQCRRLPRTDEKLTLRENIAGQAREHSLTSLWLLELGALAFVGAGVFILVRDPGKWLLVAVVLAFFGFAAVMFARMLVMRMRKARPQP
jgi:hypothetical protein